MTPEVAELKTLCLAELDRMAVEHPKGTRDRRQLDMLFDLIAVVGSK